MLGRPRELPGPGVRRSDEWTGFRANVCLPVFPELPGQASAGATNRRGSANVCLPVFPGNCWAPTSAVATNGRGSANVWLPVFPELLGPGFRRGDEWVGFRERLKLRVRRPRHADCGVDRVDLRPGLAHRG